MFFLSGGFYASDLKSKYKSPDFLQLFLLMLFLYMLVLSGSVENRLYNVEDVGPTLHKYCYTGVSVLDE